MDALTKPFATEAVEFLLAIMKNGEVAPKYRIEAANVLLNYSKLNAAPFLPTAGRL